MRVRPVTLNKFIGREGSYLLSRKKGEQKSFSFEDPIMSLTRGHILGEKPPSSEYQPHPSDVGSLEDAQELHLTDFAKIATGFEDYIFPPTLNRSAIATLLVDSTPGGMMRAVITYLLATEILPKTPTVPPDWEKEGLSCAAFDISHTDETTDKPNLATTIAPVVTRKGEQRMPHHPPTPQNSRQPTPPASPEAMPRPTPAAPPPRIRTKPQRDPGTPAVVTRKGKQRVLHHPPTVETTPTPGAAGSEANPNTCGTTPTDSNEEAKRPGYTGGGSSEREIEDASPPSNTPRTETIPTYGATRRDTSLNTCGTTSTGSNEKAKGPGHTGTYVLHSRDRDVGRDRS